MGSLKNKYTYFRELSEFKVLEHLVSEYMNTIFNGCKPWSNWTKSTIKKLAAVEKWIVAADKGGCIINNQ